jgi:hypothetical protein
MIYIRLLRYAAMLKDTAFKITGSWLSEQLAMHRNTVNSSLAQLKACGYVTDKGIVIPDADKAKTIESEQVEVKAEVAGMVNNLLALVGSKKAQKPCNAQDSCTVNNCADVAQELCNSESAMHKTSASNAQNLCFENTKNVHPIKNKEENKEENKEKNNGCEPESYPLGLQVPDALTEQSADPAVENHRRGDLITVKNSILSSDAVVVLNATSANQSGGISHA